jgi:inner membrane protein
MLIAHLPSGYLLGFVAKLVRPISSRAIMTAAVLGAMMPDMDMIYFHLIDGRRTHHHDYVTHLPLFWVAVFLFLSLVCLITKRLPFVAVLVFSLGAMLHMVLDSIAAPIHWLMPFSPQTFELVAVPATYQNWIWSFVLHWTFLLEIGIWGLASVVFLRAKKTSLEKGSVM